MKAQIQHFLLHGTKQQQKQSEKKTMFLKQLSIVFLKVFAKIIKGCCFDTSSFRNNFLSFLLIKIFIPLLFYVYYFTLEETTRK